jgi:hypothetical protein
MSQRVYRSSNNNHNNIIRDSASIDLEWIPYKGEYSHEKTKLTAAAFCTNLGTKIANNGKRTLSTNNKTRSCQA